MTAAPMPTLMLVPTGIGCAIGGYAGDALPSARLLAAASGCLITHPNVMNGAALYWSDPRIHYVEGYGLDRFAAGDWLLRPVRRPRLGLRWDAGIEPELAQRQIQVAEPAGRPGAGDRSGAEHRCAAGGASGAGRQRRRWGSLDRPDALLRRASGCGLLGRRRSPSWPVSPRILRALSWRPTARGAAWMPWRERRR